MNKIPLLNENQMERLRKLVGSNPRVNLRPDKKQPSRRQPDIPDQASKTLKVLVYNAGQTELRHGTAVNFVSSGASMKGYLIPCSAVSDVSTQWGVLTTSLLPGQGGECVVAGPVTVARIEGGGGEYAVPVIGSGAQVYSRGGEGAPILYAGASGGMILLGAGRGGGGGVTLAAVVTMPTSGGGIGAIKPIIVGSGGAITVSSGGDISARFPNLDGYN